MKLEGMSPPHASVLTAASTGEPEVSSAVPASGARQQLPRSVPIVIFADEWGGVGGTAGYIIMLTRGLCRRGYTVAVICHDGEAAAAMRATLRDVGAEILTLSDHGGVPVQRHIRRQRTLIGLMRRYPGCVLALMMGYFTRGGGVTLAAALAGARAIVRADLTPPEPPITRAQAISLRLKDRLTDRVVVGAWENVEAFSRQMGRSVTRMRVIHTGVELHRFRPGEGRGEVRVELGYAQNDVVVGTVSRLDDKRKGVACFLKMAARTASTHPRARFLVVGEGVLRPELEAYAAQLGIEERVRFAGWRADVPRVLAGMDVFVMPSLFEGGPTTVLEAMAMALPVVATRVGMVPEVIRHGETGLIVGVGNAVELADAIGTLLSNKSLRDRMATDARTYAEKHFSVENMVERYLEVFADAAALRAKQAPRQ
jgi:glycosyltransferase involved in cell wall biosynthesis